MRVDTKTYKERVSGVQDMWLARPLKGRRRKLKEYELDDFEMRRRIWGSMLAYRYVIGDGPP
jgi:hypothetical protein